MRRSFVLISIWVVMLWGAPAGSQSLETRTSTFRVAGMTCPLCAKAIEKTLAAIGGVRHVTIDQPSGRVIVSADRSVATRRIELGIESGGPYEAELVSTNDSHRRPGKGSDPDGTR